MSLTVEEAERLARNCGGNPDSEDICALLEGLTGTRKKAELEALEFKSSFSGPKRWVRFLAEAVALANSGGGLVVFGVGDSGERLGTDRGLVEELDNAKINDQLRKHSPQATLTCITQAVEYDGKTFVVVGVAHRGELVVFDKEGNVDGGSPVFRPGVVYVRRPGQKAPATHVEVGRLIQRLARDQASSLLAEIGRVVHPSSEEELVVVSADTHTEGRVLTGANEGVALRMEVVPGERGLPVKEISDPALPYGALETEVSDQVRLWKQSDATHRAQRKTLSEWYQRREELPEWSEDALEFGLRSALHVRGFPNWWAAQMAVEALDRAIHALIEENDYPTREYLPYLVASQCWPQREELWRRLLEGSGQFNNVRRAVEKLERMDYETFRRTGKTSVRTFQWQGEARSLPEVIANTALATPIFGQMLAEDGSSGLSSGLSSAQRPVAHQLDLALHARSI